jgi:dUTP pyrophosphatase
MIVKFVKVRDVKTPERGTSVAAGTDFFVPFDFNDGQPFLLKPHHDILIKSGIRAALPAGTMWMGADKSGVATSKNAMRLAGNEPKISNPESSLKVGAKIIDEDYQGEIGLHIINVGDSEQWIEPGQKIVQFILVPVIYPELIECATVDEVFTCETERGEGGFGSTGGK